MRLDLVPTSATSILSRGWDSRRSLLTRPYHAAVRYRETRLLLLLLAAVLVVQVVYFVRIQSLYPPYGLTTEHFYSPLAINLLHHGVYGTGEPPDFEMVSQRPPFYSLVLAGIYGVFGENERNGLVINNVFLWLTVALVYVLGRQISRPVGLVAALFFALDPIIYITANRNQSDILFALLLALFLLQTSKYLTTAGNMRTLLAGSLFLALATFARAASVYLWVPILIYLVSVYRLRSRRIAWRRIGVLVVAFWAIQAIFIGGWMIRNYSVRGNPDFAAEQGQLFNSFFGPLVVARAEGLSYAEAKAMLATELANDPAYQLLEGGAAERYQLFNGIGMVLDHPITAARVYLEHVPVLFINYPVPSVTLFFGQARQDEIADLLRSYQSEKSSRLDVSGYVDLFRSLRENGMLLVVAHGAVYKLFYILLLLGIAAGSVMLVFDDKNRTVGVLLVVFIGYMVFASSFWPTARLRIPIMPAGTIVAAYALLRAWDLLIIRLWKSSGRIRAIFQPAK